MPCEIKIIHTVDERLLELLHHFVHSQARIEQKVDKLMGLAEDNAAAMAKIDAATTKIASNVQIIADTDQKISDEMDAFLAGVTPGATLTQEQVDAAKALSDRLQASSDALDAQVPVLQAIAAKGNTNPVPVPVPDAPPAP